MTFKVGQTVARMNPDGRETTHQIKTPEEVTYHTDLQGRGYGYTIIDGKEPEPVFDFDLPQVDAPAPSAPRVHMGGDVCVACEG